MGRCTTELLLKAKAESMIKGFDKRENDMCFCMLFGLNYFGIISQWISQNPARDKQEISKEAIFHIK
jgi:hypothetical protein